MTKPYDKIIKSIVEIMVELYLSDDPDIVQSDIDLILKTLGEINVQLSYICSSDNKEE